jgi:hypothetical protein
LWYGSSSPPSAPLILPSIWILRKTHSILIHTTESRHTQAGLPRTSTTSLKKAFDILGIEPSFHLGDPPAPIARIRESAKTLQIADRRERQDALRNLYAGFDAVFEPPGSALVDDMMQIYPNAKVSKHLEVTMKRFLATA